MSLEQIADFGLRGTGGLISTRKDLDENFVINRRGIATSDGKFHSKRKAEPTAPTKTIEVRSELRHHAPVLQGALL